MTQDAHSADPRRQSYNYSTHRERVLPPSDIRMGHQEMPEAALFLQGRGYRWIFTTRYYSCPPWPHLLVAAMERWGKAPLNYPQRSLPIPELDKLNPDTGMPWLREAGGRELCVRYSLGQSALGYTERRAIGWG